MRPDEQPPPSRVPGSPLAHPAFRALWIAATVSYVGSFVQEIGERWLILDLTGSPQASTTLATAFVTASLVSMLPAGVLADRADRHRLVILSQLIQATSAGAVGLLSLLDLVTPAVLVAGAAVAGLGMGIGAPAFNTLVADIVRRDQVADAVTLNAVAFNIARAIGPAIGGVVIAATGPTLTFIANALTFLVVIGAVLSTRGHERARTSLLPPPTLGRAFAEPFVHAARDAGIRAVLASMVLFTSGAAFIYVLLPAFAKLTLEAGPRTYGLVIGAMGTGAILGGLLLRRLRARLGAPALVSGLMLLYGCSAIAISRVHDVGLAIALCLPAGMGWTGTFSSLSALVQIWAPEDLRARSLAVYSMLHLAMWAVGASISGALAEAWGIRETMLAGGVVCILAGLATARMPLPRTFG